MAHQIAEYVLKNIFNDFALKTCTTAICRLKSILNRTPLRKPSFKANSPSRN